MLTTGKDMLAEGLEQLLRAEKKFEVLNKAGKLIKKGFKGVSILVRMTLSFVASMFAPVQSPSRPRFLFRMERKELGKKTLTSHFSL